MFIRTIKRKHRLISSLQFQRSFQNHELCGTAFDFFSLKNGKILTGRQNKPGMCISNADDGKFLYIINVGIVSEAIWTPLGNIAYLKNRKAFVMSKNGIFINSTDMNDPLHISTSNDELYIADFESGVYQSIDDGRSWRHIFQASNNWGSFASFKINDMFKEYYWSYDKRRRSLHDDFKALRIYEKNEKNNTYMVQKIIDIPKYCRLYSICSLFYDGEDNVFMLDFTGEVMLLYSVNGEKRMELKSLNVTHFVYLSVDTNKGLLYIGISRGEVKEYTITYKNY